MILVTAGFILAARGAARQESQVPPHPWFETATWDVRAPAADALCAQPPAADGAVIYVLPVRKSPAGWEVRCAARPAVDTFLKNSAHADWILAVEAGAGEDLDRFAELVDAVPGKHIGIWTRSQRAARALRKKAPHWVFAADDASLTRLHLFTSLFLESVFDFWPDFVIADDGEGAARLTAREAAEVQRRFEAYRVERRGRSPLRGQRRSATDSAQVVLRPRPNRLSLCEMTLIPSAWASDTIQVAADTGALHAISTASIVVQLTLLCLIMMSVVSWAIMLFKRRQFATVEKKNVPFEDSFWRAQTLEQVHDHVADHPESNLAVIFRQGYLEMKRLAEGSGNATTLGASGIENLERSSAQGHRLEIARLESRLIFLATVGSVGPFIGLFGTVWAS